MEKNIRIHDHLNLCFCNPTDKILVIAVVEELQPLEKLASGKEEEFRDLLDAIALTYDSRDNFIFGWTSAVDTINSLTLQSVKNLPSLVFINSTSKHFSVHDKDLLPQNVIELLKKVSSHQHDWSGGDSYWTYCRRMLFDSIVSFVKMYHANPILTLLMFGLPLAFLSFIIYSACFADFIDAPDDEDEGKITH